MERFDKVLFFSSAPEPGKRAANGAVSRTGPVHGAGPEAPVRTGLSRTPLHAIAVRLWGEPHAGAGPAGGVWANAVSDGARWQLPRNGWHGQHGSPSCQHDETQDDDRQQTHEASAATEAAGTAGMSTGGQLSIHTPYASGTK